VKLDLIWNISTEKEVIDCYPTNVSVFQIFDDKITFYPWLINKGVLYIELFLNENNKFKTFKVP
jgi:hypothetical protein